LVEEDMAETAARKKKAALRADIANRKQAFIRDEIEAAAAALFADRGYRAVTMDDVAESLGYTKSVIYYYFKNKNEILWQIYCRSFEVYSAAVEAVRGVAESPAAAMRAMVQEHAKCVMRNKHYTAIYNREESELDPQQRKQLNKLRRNYDEMFEAVYKAGVAQGQFKDIPPHVAVSGILGMCNWLHAWYDASGKLTADQIADYYASLLASGYLGSSE
jgi:AcrR family transcriptional regulator